MPKKWSSPAPLPPTSKLTSTTAREDVSLPALTTTEVTVTPLLQPFSVLALGVLAPAMCSTDCRRGYTGAVLATGTTDLSTADPDACKVHDGADGFISAAISCCSIKS